MEGRLPFEFRARVTRAAKRPVHAVAALSFAFNRRFPGAVTGESSQQLRFPSPASTAR
jgi:hypothetical protein